MFLKANDKLHPKKSTKPYLQICFLKPIFPKELNLLSKEHYHFVFAYNLPPISQL